MVHIVDNWPYTNLHNINLDWVLQQIKTLGYKMDNLEGFFPKISDWNNGEWDIDHAYNPNEIVTNGNDIYMAKTNVPTGVNISNTDYWLLVGTDSYITDKVDKSGDTMTGRLKVPNPIIYNSDFPSLEFATSADGATIGGVWEDVESKRVVLRQVHPSGHYEDYILPGNSAVNTNETYELITSKDGVLGLVEHTETITVPAQTWTVVNINQFSVPAGYKQIAMVLAGSESFDARNNLYVMPNAMSNMNRLLVYSVEALTGVQITLDAWFVRTEDYKSI